jgi:hypothetical protein
LTCRRRSQPSRASTWRSSTLPRTDLSVLRREDGVPRSPKTEHGFNPSIRPPHPHWQHARRLREVVHPGSVSSPLRVVTVDAQGNVYGGLPHGRGEIRAGARSANELTSGTAPRRLRNARIDRTLGSGLLATPRGAVLDQVTDVQIRVHDARVADRVNFIVLCVDLPGTNRLLLAI